MLSMYTEGSQRTFKIQMRVPLLIVSDDTGVFTAKQLYCIYKYDFKHLELC